MLVVGSDEGKIPGFHQSALAVEQVAAATTLNPEEFVVVLGMHVWRGGVTVVIGLVGTGVRLRPVRG